MQASTLHIDQLRIGHHHQALCKPISVSADTGELIGLIGRNGTGKSTLLHTLSGYLKPVSGSIRLNKQILHTLPHWKKTARIGIVSTSVNQTCGLSVYEILSTAFHHQTNWKHTLTQAHKKSIAEVSDLFSIAHLHHKKSFEISDGERQRVMIAASYARNTPILLLDEPTAYLDIPNKIHVFQLLNQIARSGKLVIFTSHDIHFAWENMDRCWLLNSQSKELEELSMNEEPSIRINTDFNHYILNKLK